MTLTEIFRHQGRHEIAELLTKSHALAEQVDYDNWNGGTTIWALRLRIPVDLFAEVEARLPAIETELEKKIERFNRDSSGDVLRALTIEPLLIGHELVGQRLAPAERDVQRLWGDDSFRLFISHLSNDRVLAKAVSDALSLRGIKAFVAHEHIEPTRQWQEEIELALRSMHALAALLTPGFHVSKWTDHEIGWALGRGVVVVPIRLGVDPYGLISKIQGKTGSVGQPNKLAEGIAETLMRNTHSHGEMRRAVIRAIQIARTAESAKALRPLLSLAPDLSNDEKDALWSACKNNDVIRNTAGVLNEIEALAGKPPASVSEDEIPF